jgi:hypothetical protein
VAFGKIFLIRKCFQRSKENLHIYFLWNARQAKNLITVYASAESTDLIL